MERLPGVFRIWKIHLFLSFCLLPLFFALAPDFLRTLDVFTLGGALKLALLLLSGALFLFSRPLGAVALILSLISARGGLAFLASAYSLLVPAYLLERKGSSLVLRIGKALNGLVETASSPGTLIGDFRGKLLHFSLSCLFFPAVSFALADSVVPGVSELHSAKRAVFIFALFFLSALLSATNPLSGVFSGLLVLFSPASSAIFIFISFAGIAGLWALGVLRITKGRGFSILAVLAVAGAFLISYVRIMLIVPMEKELFWKISAFSERPLGCFLEGSRGNYAIGGSFFPGYSSIFPVLFGRTETSLALAGALVSISAGFLVYFVSRRLYGKAVGAITVAGLLFLSKFMPFVNIYYQETAFQGFLSMAFVSALLVWLERGERRIVPLLGLIAGIGILNKLFFLHFLLACLISVAVLFPEKLAKILGELPLFFLFLLLGALPFIYYNFSFGFPTFHFLGEGAENVLSPGWFGQALSLRLHWFILAIFPANSTAFGQAILFLTLGAILLSIIFSGNRGARLVFLSAFLTIVLSSASYTSKFNKMSMSAVTPLILVVSGVLPFVLFRVFPEKFDWSAFFLSILFAIAAFSLVFNIFSLGKIVERGSLEKGAPVRGVLQVSSCVDGAFVSYFSQAGESVLFNGTSSCDSHSFSRTLPGKYFGSVEEPGLGDSLDSFVLACEKEGFEFSRKSGWYSRGILVPS